MDAVPDAAPTAPTPPTPTPGFLLMSLGRTVRERADAALKPENLSLRHFSALGHLSRRPGLSYSDLARRAGVTAQSMQATLTQLETLGAVRRATEPGRGRTAHLEVTPSGRELLERSRATVARIEQDLLAALTDAERTTLTRILAKAFRTTLP